MAQQTDISKMETTSTAVEWLASKLSITFQTMYDEEIKQAKAMEKKQILDAIICNQNGLLRRKDILDAEKYYNETYNK